MDTTEDYYVLTSFGLFIINLTAFIYLCAVIYMIYRIIKKCCYRPQIINIYNNVDETNELNIAVQ